MDFAPAATRRVDRAFIAWAVLVFALLFLGLVPLYVLHLDLAKLAANSSGAPPIALIGILFTAYTPTIAALLIAWRWPRAGGVRRLLKPLTRWRVHAGWYLLALLGPIPLLLFGDLIYVLLGGNAPRQWLAPPSGTAEGGMSALLFTIGAVIAGAIGEELGWRGLGQARLQAGIGALWAAVVIGLLWSTWHLWPVAVPGGLSLFDWTDFPQTYLRLTSTAILYAWLYNSTRGSLLLVLVAHGAFNIASSIVQTPASDVHTIPIIVAVLHGLAALVVVLATNPRTLTRRNAQLALPAAEIELDSDARPK
ncbi:MAG TPA: CPBP family intramembrane glutamic endopeptidase [Candidatus Dormibacteraeota bacterium]|nr:CPBP family intramembrane glutamic endopeptidase [Candidatus Dormibacteraeota bacterium]